MSKVVSNSDIMEMFRDIDTFISTSDMTEEEKARVVKKKHDEIVESLSFLVYNKAKPYRNFPNYEDLVQEGFVGLIRSVKKFKHHMFPNFFVFSNQWITHYIKRAASRFDVVYNPNKSRVVYSEPSEDEVDLQPGPDEVLFDKECKNEIEQVLKELPEKERQIVKEIFGLDCDPKTLREIGPQFNLTHERIRQIKNSVLDKLKKDDNICKLNNEFR